MPEPITVTLRVLPVDTGPSFTAGMIVGLLRGAGLHVTALDLDLGAEGLDSIADVDAALVERLTREAVHPADHGLLPTRPNVDHEAVRARAVQGF